MSAIRIDALTFTYTGGDAPALRDVDLRVDDGELVVINGPSGGGKSTLLRAIAGLVPHFHGGSMRGRLSVAGRDPLAGGPRALATAVASVFQDPEAQAVFDTVWQDVAFGPLAARRAEREVRRDVSRALDDCGVAHLADRSIASLSGGERQRVAVASAVAVNPRVLLLDEPTSQLDAEGVTALVTAIDALRNRRGVTVVVADHRPERWRLSRPRLLRVADGRIGPAGPIGDEPPAPVARGAGERVALEARGLRVGFGSTCVLRDLGVSIAAGRATVLRGPNGSGKSTLLRTLAGLVVPEAGEIALHGRSITAVGAEGRFPAIAFVPDSSSRAMVTERVLDEIAWGLGNIGIGNDDRARRSAEAAESLGLTGLLDRHPLDLSVGERERVALAGALAARPDVLVLDEPTRALDPERIDDLTALLRELTCRGTAVVVATHDGRFARALADRTITMAADGASGHAVAA
jgi:energy-coupling factor transporter ATP-binding protein EcfA2